MSNYDLEFICLYRLDLAAYTYACILVILVTTVWVLPQCSWAKAWKYSFVNWNLYYAGKKVFM